MLTITERVKYHPGPHGYETGPQNPLAENAGDRFFDVRGPENQLLGTIFSESFAREINTMFNYLNDCLRTEAASPNEETRLLHAGMGFATEAGEFMDAIKRLWFYKKPVDKINLKEEVGDMLWYCSIALSVLGITYAEAMKANIDKLKKRFPDKFTHQDALTRNLDEERKALEAK